MNIPTQVQEKLSAYKGRFPVPVVALANDLGIDVYQTNDLSDRESGMIKREGNKYVIYVNERHPATRKLFTIAHEIAHFAKHKDQLDGGDEHIDSIDQPVLNGSTGNMLKREDGRVLTDEQKKIESEANTIAAEILMPEQEFVQVFKLANSLEEVAEKFGVSTAAAAIRAKCLIGEVIF